MSLTFDPPVIAHRGASAYAPENTMVAFMRAVQMGITWVEFDVLLAACGMPIIIHDETLERTTSAQGEVAIRDYAWLRGLDAGAWFDAKYAGERIPTLAQVTELMADTGLKANVEIKPLPGQDEATVLAALRVISTHFDLACDSLLFSSFSLPALQFLRQYAPTCHLGLLMHEWLPNWREVADSLNCISVHVNNDILTEVYAKEIKASERLLLCYTVNDIARAEELFSWGVDAVFSDCPDKIASFSCRV